MVNKLRAIFWRDFLNASSYRLGFVLQFGTPLMTIVSFFFIGQLLNTASIPGLSEYGGSYFAFALVGLLVNMYMGIALGTVTSTIRQGQLLGILEVILTTQTNLATYLLGSSLYATLRATVFMIVYLVVGALLFGVRFTGANIEGALMVLVLSMAVMAAVSIFSGSFILVFKQGDPFSVLLTSGGFLLSGVVYPVQVLPSWLQPLSVVFPQTYALHAMRLALLKGAPLSALSQDLMALGLFALIMLPLGLLAFKFAVYRARTEGSFALF